MSRQPIEKPNILRELGDGLVLRRARPEDAEDLIAFNEKIFNHPEIEEETEDIAGWIGGLFSGKHPTVSPGDFTIVEDTARKSIVSCLCLISQTWSYSGIKFGVGRTELVATHPDYRCRGLVRQQFEILHQWSARRKEKVQAITGIPYFYRRFGYEMALDLFPGHYCSPGELPKEKKAESGHYRVRPARENDAPFISRLYRQGMKRYLVSCERNELLWHFELKRRLQGFSQRVIRIIETKQGEPLGFLVYQGGMYSNTFGASLYELKPGSDWLAITPAVVKYLWKTGEKFALRDKKALERFGFWVGAGHPAYQVIPALKREKQSYAFYLRVADIPDFLHHIRPVLEQRLTESVAAGHRGELKLGFYRQGVRLEMNRGRIEKIEAWPSEPKASAFFPNLTFLQLLFGYRSLEELNHAYPDCWVREEEAGVLLPILFPQQPSNVWPVA